MGYLRRHVLFIGALALGTAVRVAASFAFQPGFEYADSREYLILAAQLLPNGHRPIGYSIFLKPLAVTGQFASVFVAQHALGLLAGVLLYVLLLRLRVRPWLAALGCLPVLLDAYQVNIEHYILAETLAEALLVAALAILLWSDPPRWWQWIAAGLLLAAVADTRAAAVPLVAPAVLFVLVRTPGWRRLAAAGGLALTFAAPLAANAWWNHASGGPLALSDYTGQYLYGRVAVFADCARVPVAETERRLCPDPAHRLDVTGYIWGDDSPINQPWPGFTFQEKQQVAFDFSMKVLRAQPLDYLAMSGRDTLRSITPLRDSQNWPWVFSDRPPLMADHGFAVAENGTVRETLVGWRVRPRAAQALGVYQTVAATPGPLLGLMALAALLAGAGLLRPSAGQRRLRWAALLLGAVGLTLVVVPSATIGFDWRYLLPSLVALPPAAVAAAEVLLTWLAARPAREEAPDYGAAASPSSASPSSR